MMPRILEETAADREVDTLNAVMTAAEERDALDAFRQRPGGVADPDLTDGGKFGNVTMYPMKNGMRVEKGRPAGRRAWMWNGTETTLTLAWNPDGTQHDGGRRYLMKKHCLCCNYSGFRTPQCPVCVKNNCFTCRGSTSRKAQKDMRGKEFQGYIIPLNYLREEDVPFPVNMYGDVDCMFAYMNGQPACPRREGKGFKSEGDMLLHASMRHRQEYRIQQDVMARQKTSETDELRRRLDALTNLLLQQGINPAVEPRERRIPDSNRGEMFKERMAKARAARAAKKQQEQAQSVREPSQA